MAGINSITDTAFLNKMHYAGQGKLEKRIDLWRKFGTNKIGLCDFILDTGVQGGRLADVGCGRGDFANAASRRRGFEQIFCIDSSNEMLNSCKSFTNNKFNYVAADIINLPFELGFFDVSVAKHVFHHVANIRKGIMELRRVTKKNGIIIITTSDHFLDQGLNKIHYAGLEELGFPIFMHDKRECVRFDPSKARAHIKAVFDEFEDYVYDNDMVFYDVAPALDYYKSSMLFRNSYGVADSRVEKNLWDKLLNFVGAGIAAEIKKNGKFIVRGRVHSFKIKNAGPAIEREIKEDMHRILIAHRHKFNQLYKKKNFSRPSTNVRRVIDMFLFDDIEFNKFKSAVVDYDGVNLGLTQFHNGKNLDYIHKIKESGLKILSAHGTSIKAQIRSGEDYRSILERDLAVAKIIDPGEGITINFDLFAGKWIDLEDYVVSKKKNLEFLAEKLNLSVPDEMLVYKKIAMDVASVFGRHGYKIVFEIPGSMGWSLMPEINHITIKNICEVIDTCCPGAKICIDTGHLMTWVVNKPKRFLHEAMLALREVSMRIGMLHISNAGSYVPEFVRAYHKIHGLQPSWHVRGLDLQLPLDEGLQLNIIKKIRSWTTGEPVYEVSEARYEGAAIKDYFPNIDYDFNKKEQYYNEIRLQSDMLGYKKINFGVVGCGHISHRHFNAIQQNRDARLVATCDREEKLAIEAKVKYGAAKHYMSYDKMLCDRDIDVVIICTPSGMHSEMAIMAARAGKHAVVEKPLALNVSDAQMVLAEFKKARKSVAAVLQYRFKDSLVKLKQEVKDGQMGKLLLLNVAQRWYRPQEYYDSWRKSGDMCKGILMNQGVHFADALVFITGKLPKSVFCYAETLLHNIDLPDSAAIVMKFEDNSLAILESSTIARPENLEGSLTALFENGQIKLSGVSLDKVDLWKLNGKEKKIAWKMQAQEHNKVIANMVNHLLCDEKLTVTGSDAVKSLKLIEACYKSAAEKREVKL